MKTLPSVTRFFCFALPLFVTSLALNGCDQPKAEEIAQEIHLQADEVECEDLSTDDLDLSAGFTGITRKNTSPGLPDFEIIGYNGIFDFQPTVLNGNCRAYCSLDVEFDGFEGDYSTLEIQSIEIHYYVGSTYQTETLDPMHYFWTYPDLTITGLAFNSLADYSIDFVGSQGTDLNLATVTTSGGLCIVDNVDLTDPAHVVFGSNGSEFR